MIAKCKAIAHGSNALEYIFRKGKFGRLLALHDLCGETPKEIHEEMKLIGDYNSRCKNRFLRIEIGIAPQDEPRTTINGWPSRTRTPTTCTCTSSPIGLASADRSTTLLSSATEPREWPKNSAASMG